MVKRKKVSMCTVFNFPILSFVFAKANKFGVVSLQIAIDFFAYSCPLPKSQ